MMEDIGEDRVVVEDNYLDLELVAYRCWHVHNFEAVVEDIEEDNLVDVAEDNFALEEGIVEDVGEDIGDYNYLVEVDYMFAHVDNKFHQDHYYN